ncbi:MAG TPA: hypothetical protein DCZ95_04245 [Verrucomicrobia bacterium]|nr:MAG: hypothetical protein A2X46_15175 [Lentisphaerae bacterium GWF2_57_35]HBA83286.1 hypothetical protein [Verrucomicrobiota bacterium]
MAVNEMREAIREARRIIEDVQKSDGNEAETRRRVERIFEAVMGYDAFKHLSREHAVHGVGDTEHLDFAINLTPEKVSIVVELKRVNVDLAPKHLKQAMRYAVDLGCEWVLLTNGRQWELHHIEFGQPPETMLIKAWNLMLDDIAELEEHFDILSLRSLKKEVLKDLWETQSALTPECLLDEILSEDSLRAYKNSIRRKTGASVNPEDIVGAIRRLLNDNAGAMMDQMKISLPERKSRTSKTAASEVIPPPASEPVVVVQQSNAQTVPPPM